MRVLTTAVWACCLTLLLGCSSSHSDIDSGLLDASADIDAGTDASVDASVGPDSGTGTDAVSDPDAAPDITYHGVVSVGDVAGGVFAGQIRAAFVPALDLAILEGGRNPIPGAPECFEILPPPPVVPTYLDAGTLLFQGLLLTDHTLDQNPAGDYSFDYAGLLESPGDIITLTVPGAAEIEPVVANVVTPTPADVQNWTLGSTGVWTNWTAGNGDFVVLRFYTSTGERVCQVPDTGSFLVPAQALAPEDVPSGGYFIFQRVIESTVLSASGTQNLRFRAFAEDQML